MRSGKYRKIGLVISVVVISISIWLFVNKSEPISADRYVEPDRLFSQVESNIRDNTNFEVIVDIDHSRLGAEAGSPMPPSHVLVYSDLELDASIIQQSSIAAIDLPLRVLVYEDPESGTAKVISNSFEFLVGRHSLKLDESVRARYEASVASAMRGIAKTSIANFRTDSMPNSGLITFSSPFSFAETERRVTEAINAQGDTVVFGSVDFSERLKAQGVSIEPLLLILFGGPGPGGKAMLSAPTLGLDAFCQKLLIWQDDNGAVHVALNDLLVLAERQEVSFGLPLRIINNRLKKTFSTALEN